VLRVHEWEGINSIAIEIWHTRSHRNTDTQTHTHTHTHTHPLSLSLLLSHTHSLSGCACWVCMSGRVSTLFPLKCGYCPFGFLFTQVRQQNIFSFMWICMCHVRMNYSRGNVDVALLGSISPRGHVLCCMCDSYRNE